VSVCALGICGIAPLGGSIAKGVVGHAAKGTAEATASAVLTAFSGGVVAGATWVVSHVVGLLTNTTKVAFAVPWFEQQERAMLGIAALAVGPLLAAATIGAIIRQDGRRLMRVFGVGLPVGILGAVTAVALTQWALGVVDEMCLLIRSSDDYHAFDKLGSWLGEPGIPALVQFVVGSVVFLAAVALWMEMVLRAAAVYIAVLFLPLGLAAFVWPATAPITKRFVEILVAVIGSKFVIVATLTLGEGFVAHPGASIDDTVTGAAILLLAAFAPFAVLRLVPLVEASAMAHLEGASRRPGRAVARAATSGTRLGGALGALTGGGEGGLVADGVNPVGIAERVGDWAPAEGGGGHSPPPPGPAGRTGGEPTGPVTPSGPESGPGSGGPSDGGGAPPPGASVTGTRLSPAPSAERPGEQGPEPAVLGGETFAVPAIPALPAVVPGHRGPEPDGWSDDT
jgi:hypothetical protein